MVARRKKPLYIIGVDEVGRGPIAGPVTVCACAMPVTVYKKMQWGKLTDSKKMTPRDREYWHNRAKELRQMMRCDFAVVSKTARQIDARGIGVVIRSSIKQALQKLALDPDEVHVLLDGGLRAPLSYQKQKTIIRGDCTEKIISLASVIAKVSRDTYMKKQHLKFPAYLWCENKGYGTRAHRQAILVYGLSPLHRRSFKIKE